ncbi:MAG: NAD-dependent epimerase/dehydratase family protein, partial [Acidimicrobiales bacterium]
TGASGCIGAWTVLTLAQEGAKVVALHRGTANERLRLIGGDELEPPIAVNVDIRDLGGLERALSEHAVTHIVHLAALLAPFCQADPALGAEVNVAGTTNVFEAARRHGLRAPIAYASSAAVYDADGETFTPTTIYGVYKVANEGSARIYWQESQVASVGLRPLIVYGGGRDQGTTSSPTLAMAAAARGEAFNIPFGGSTQLQYGADAARAFIDAARRPAHGAEVYNLGGPDVTVAEIVAAIEDAAPGAQVTFDDVALPFASRLPPPWFEMNVTPLAEGVAATVELYRRASRPAPPVPID